VRGNCGAHGERIVVTLSREFVADYETRVSLEKRREVRKFPCPLNRGIRT